MMDDVRKRVLIVEDEALVAMGLAMDLRRAGFEVVATVASGGKAIDKARANPVDAILMDIGLPGDIDGVQAAVQIRSFSAVPIVFMTGYADRENDPQITAVQPLGFLIKPVSFSSIESLLHTL